MKPSPNLPQSFPEPELPRGRLGKLLLKDGLIKLGLEVDERRYVPHIAIAKVGNFELSPFQEAQFEKIMSEEYKPIKINCLKLFESIPEEGFHRHNTLAEIPLEAV
ncbi:MAG: hypothetical protein V1808_03530 [Candidatus Daviesbacteria bacterium]